MLRYSVLYLSYRILTDFLYINEIPVCVNNLLYIVPIYWPVLQLITLPPYSFKKNNKKNKKTTFVLRQIVGRSHHSPLFSSHCELISLGVCKLESSKQFFFSSLSLPPPPVFFSCFVTVTEYFFQNITLNSTFFLFSLSFSSLLWSFKAGLQNLILSRLVWV